MVRKKPTRNAWRNSWQTCLRSVSAFQTWWGGNVSSSTLKTLSRQFLISNFLLRNKTPKKVRCTASSRLKVDSPNPYLFLTLLSRSPSTRKLSPSYSWLCRPTSQHTTFPTRFTNWLVQRFSLKSKSLTTTMKNLGRISLSWSRKVLRLKQTLVQTNNF